MYVYIYIYVRIQSVAYIFALSILIDMSKQVTMVFGLVADVGSSCVPCHISLLLLFFSSGS